MLRHQWGIVYDKPNLKLKYSAIHRFEHRACIPKQYAKHLDAYIRHQMMGEKLCTQLERLNNRTEKLM